MIVRKARKSDLRAVMKMARKMWPDVKTSDLRPDYLFYIAEEDERLIGFILLNIRRDYVAGSTTWPVGYIEGLYVEKEWRKKGVGRQLVQAAEEWCAGKGFKELGSDVDLHNKISQQFHSRAGFKKGKLIVPYIKKVRPR